MISTDGKISPAKKDLACYNRCQAEKAENMHSCCKANHVLGYIKRATVGQSWEVIIPPHSVLVRLHTEYYILAPQFKRDVKTGSRGL